MPMIGSLLRSAYAQTVASGRPSLAHKTGRLVPLSTRGPSPIGRVEGIRTLSSSIRVPSLGDISPHKAAEFDARQKEFRKRLVDESKRRAEERAAAVEQRRKDAAEARLADNSNRKQDKSRLSSLIYGTDEVRQLDNEIERSFSQMLARGKYVHSIVIHNVSPDKVEEYSQLVGEWYPRIAAMPDNHVNLVGSWRTEVGDCDTFIHIWEYEQYAGYHSTWHTIKQLPDHRDFDAKLRTLVRAKNTSLMQEFSFWPTSPPRTLGGLFELRSYTLHPGNLLEWESHWRRGLEARREVMEGVGAWFVQIGELDTVHHLWQFANLEERKRRREQSWEVEGWGKTVHKTVPLIKSMKSRILLPMPWSPVA